MSDGKISLLKFGWWYSSTVPCLHSASTDTNLYLPYVFLSLTEAIRMESQSNLWALLGVIPQNKINIFCIIGNLSWKLHFEMDFALE